MRPLTPFTTSWDDGSELDARLGSLLTDFGLLGTFYATTGPGGMRTITDEALASPRGPSTSLVTMGGLMLDSRRLSGDEIRRELEWGTLELSRFGQASALVAPPFGKIDARVEKLVTSFGYVVRTAPDSLQREEHCAPDRANVHVLPTALACGCPQHRAARNAPGRFLSSEPGDSAKTFAVAPWT